MRKVVVYEKADVDKWYALKFQGASRLTAEKERLNYREEAHCVDIQAVHASKELIRIDGLCTAPSKRE